MSPGCPWDVRGGRPGLKASVRPSKPRENKHVYADCDIHDPNVPTSVTPKLSLSGVSKGGVL